jgi:hypothetical protein
VARGYKDYRQVTTAEEPEGKASVHNTTRLYDDFEDTPLKWTAHHIDACSERRVAEAAYNGSFGLEICAQRTVSPYGQNLLERYTPLGERRTMELSTYWRCSSDPIHAVFEFMIQHWEGIQELRAGIRYVHDTLTPLYRWELNTLAGWIPLVGSERPFTGTWHEIVLTCDFTSGRYLYARSNHHVFPICGEQLLAIGAAIGERNRVGLQIQEYNGDTVCLHADDVLLKEL